jgi:cell wall-associated NlpC family hydrolase
VSERNPAAGAVLILVGGWVFAQVTMGDLVDRIGSFAPGGGGDYPQGPQGSAAVLPGGLRRRQKFVELLLSQKGDDYVFGGEVKPGTKNPNRYDCSEFIQWAMIRLGFKNFVDGSAAQIAHAGRMSIARAKLTAGAVLYKPGHIEVSIGGGKTVAARNSQAGVGVFKASDIKWTRAGMFPELQVLARPKSSRPAAGSPGWVSR